ncbi:6-phosphogluconolactonase [Halioglobus japonicus]|uniref:6-phosphogluconolactonase n=2 Tax=Halioglobus japonicus TaxID=930805 RepID=A0AAP8SMF9_9GAMM|nr:6-phosphogluconolactonase [Halioglobus japonicus]PLW85532.1 6-phosphogluconolactonase [Halioglobus japonicus]GHD16138.1 6-phosphogluconolactonase [Halioglobus japonicus]
MNNREHFGDRPALDKALAAHIAGLLQADIDTRGRAGLALSGGSTPKGMFAALAQCDIAWQNVCITLVDERWVAPDHEDSNERLVREHLLTGHAAAATFVSLTGDAANAADGLGEVTARFSDFPLPFTCVVLGMGGDGHTASWFPKASNLQALIDPANPALLGTCDPVTAPHQRVTFTLPAVLAAGSIILHITGTEKRDVLDAAADQHYPIAAVTEQHDNPVTTWWAP